MFAEARLFLDGSAVPCWSVEGEGGRSCWNCRREVALRLGLKEPSLLESGQPVHVDVAVDRTTFSLDAVVVDVIGASLILRPML